MLHFSQWGTRATSAITYDGVKLWNKNECRIFHVESCGSKKKI
jgi:hypothetical protein